MSREGEIYTSILLNTGPAVSGFFCVSQMLWYLDTDYYLKQNLQQRGTGEHNANPVDKNRNARMTMSYLLPSLWLDFLHAPRSAALLDKTLVWQERWNELKHIYFSCNSWKTLNSSTEQVLFCHFQSSSCQSLAVDRFITVWVSLCLKDML